MASVAGRLRAPHDGDCDGLSGLRPSLALKQRHPAALHHHHGPRLGGRDRGGDCSAAPARIDLSTGSALAEPRTWHLEVAAVQDLTPRMRRVQLTSPDLDPFD